MKESSLSSLPTGRAARRGWLGRFAWVSTCSTIGLLGLASCSGEVGGPGTDEQTAGGNSGSPTGGSGGNSGTGKTTGGTAGSAGSTGTSGAGGVGGTMAGTSKDPGIGFVLPTEKPQTVLVPSSRFARLSHTQWVNAVYDLVQLPDLGGLEEKVTKDAVPYFDNEGDRLYVQDALRGDLETMAESISQRVVGDKATMAKLSPKTPSTAQEKSDFVKGLGAKAYRRPLTDAELTEALGLYNKASTLTTAGMDTHLAGVQVLLQFFMQSVHFLYREELGTTAVAGKIPLSDFEVASKLSFALTNKPPDAAMLSAATAGQLHTSEALVTQATRLIGGSLDVVDHFNFQVLKLGGYDSIIKDAKVFPKFGATSAASMRQETTAFVEWIFNQNLGIRELFTKPTTFLNADTAKIYGASGNFSNTMLTKVDLKPEERAGLLTQPGYLALHAYQTDVDTIHRGVFVNDRLLCVELPPPSPLATPLPPAMGVMTNRQRVEAHTGKGTCGESCHGRWINPAGYAFEEYDGIGAFRTTDNGLAVDSSSSYKFVVHTTATEDGDVDVEASYKNAVEFSHLLGESAQAHSCYAGQLMSYLFARGIDMADKDKTIVNYLTQESLAGRASIKDIVQLLATTDNFLSRLPGVQ